MKIFTQKYLRMSSEIFEILGILLLKILNTSEIFGIYISNNLIFNKSYETQEPLQSLSSPRQPLQNVQNNNNDSSPHSV